MEIVKSADTIEGKPISEGFVEKLVFCGGISDGRKIQFLQINYMFPEGFTYKGLQRRMDISRRTAYRIVAQMKEVGLIQPKYDEDLGTQYAKYMIKDTFK